MFIVTVVEFNKEENHTPQYIAKTVLVRSPEKAAEFADSYMRNRHYYKGYDGKQYPHFDIDDIEIYE